MTAAYKTDDHPAFGEALLIGREGLLSLLPRGVDRGNRQAGVCHVWKACSDDHGGRACVSDTPRYHFMRAHLRAHEKQTIKRLQRGFLT